MTTKCKGGREFNYNEKNSIVCDATNEDVLLKSQEIYHKCLDGYYNREEIREDFINKVNISKNKFIDILKVLLDKINFELNQDEVIKDILSIRYIARN